MRLAERVSIVRRSLRRKGPTAGRVREKRRPGRCCSGKPRESASAFGATSLATVIQMVANGYGVTLVPEIASQTKARNKRVSLKRFAAPEPGRTIGLVWRRTSPRRRDFEALGQAVKQALRG